MASIEEETLIWIRQYMPVMIEYAVTPTDQWLRDAIRGSAGIEPPKLYRVIVQGTWEAERVVNTLANLKLKRGRPYGGAIHRKASSAEIKGVSYSNV